MRAAIGRVVASGRRLFQAHRDLLQAEIEAIVEELKGVSALVGAIIALALFVAMLVPVGTTLFLGECIFGSIGWGVLHGALLSAFAIVVMALVLVEAPRSVLVGGIAWGIVLGVLVGFVLGANLCRQGATWVVEQLQAGPMPGLPSDWGPAIVGAVVGGIVLGIIGLAGSLSTAFGGLVAGAILGLWLAGMTFSWQGAVAVGVTVFFAAAMAIMGVLAARADFDPFARFRRLYPQQSIEAAQQTKVWLEELWTKRRTPSSSA
jgi:MFS family permease